MSSRGSSSQGQKRSNKSGKSSNTSFASNSGLTLKSSAYDRDFEQKCIDHGIYRPGQDVEPKNLQELQERLALSRPSLSPSQFSDGAFKGFCKAETAARDERDVIRNALPTILGRNNLENALAEDVRFTNMQDMAPDVFKKPKPDFYWGAQSEQIDRRVRQDLNHQIVPSTKDTYPAAPNFFLEVKGPDGSAAKKTMQACYDGAIGARAMHALQGYGQAEPTYDNKAYTYSSTYHDGTLKMYSHHPAQPSRPGESPQYHMTKVGGWELTGSPQTFRQGVGAFRNARDLGREQREMLIDQANAVTRTQSADTTSFNDSNSQETVTSLRGRLIDSDTSADELALDCPIAISRTKRQKKGEETRQPTSTTPIEVESQQVLIGSTPGRQLSLNGQKVFIPDFSWIPASRNGRKALFSSDKNVYTFIESKEPSSMQEYFLPSEGISENVIKAYVTRYCGNAAEVATVSFKVCCKHFFRKERSSRSLGKGKLPLPRKRSTKCGRHLADEGYYTTRSKPTTSQERKGGLSLCEYRVNTIV